MSSGGPKPGLSQQTEALSSPGVLIADFFDKHEQYPGEDMSIMCDRDDIVNLIMQAVAWGEANKAE